MRIEPWVGVWALVSLAFLGWGPAIVTSHNPLTWLAAWMFSVNASHLLWNLLVGALASMWAGPHQLVCFLAGCLVSSAVQMNACGASGGVFALMCLAGVRLWTRERSWGASMAVATAALLMSDPIAAHVAGCAVGLVCATVSTRQEVAHDEAEL